MATVKAFTPDWLEWICTNVDLGVKKDSIFKILLDEGYAYETIQQELKHTPSVPLKNLVNPFTQAMLNRRAPHEFLPNYTRTGFQKFSVPEPLFKKILAFYHENQFAQKDEYVKDYIFNALTPDVATSTLMDLSSELRKEIHDAIKPMLEAWCGKAVEPTFVYGIRTYKDKAVLKPHRDRIETHIFGTIINVDQVVREDWLLMIEDHLYHEHQIILKPGEMIFYESARLKHGRPIPFEGDVFANIFCHFKPVCYVPQQAVKI
jgi:prolyl 4-hydroxylase